MPRSTRFLRAACLGVVCVFVCPVGGATGQAQPPTQPGESTQAQAPSEAKSMGQLAPFLLYGQDTNGPWIGETDGNGYRLINPEDPGAVVYFFTDANPDALAPRDVSVGTVVLQGDGAAGLLHGYQDDPKSYYLYTIRGDGRIEVLHRQPQGGFASIFNAQLEAPEEQTGPRLVTLRMVETAGGVDVYFNEGKLHTIETAKAGGGVGVAASGQIDALFLDFKLEDAAE